MPTGNKIATGLESLDSFLKGGFSDGHLFTLTGFCEEGTTSLSLTVALNVATMNNRIAYITLDTTPEKILHRAISMLAEIPTLELRKRTLSQNQIEQIKKLKDSNFIVRDASNEEELYTRCTELHTNYSKEKTDLIIIDSLNSLGVDYHSYPYFYAEKVLKKLKDLSGALDLPILLITRVAHKSHQLLFPDESKTFPDFKLEKLKPHTDINFILSKRREDDNDNLAFLKIDGQQKSFALRFNHDTNVFFDNNENIPIEEESFTDRFIRAQKNSERRAALSSDPTIGTFWESLSH